MFGVCGALLAFLSLVALTRLLSPFSSRITNQLKTTSQLIRLQLIQLVLKPFLLLFFAYLVDNQIVVKSVLLSLLIFVTNAFFYSSSQLKHWLLLFLSGLQQVLLTYLSASILWHFYYLQPLYKKHYSKSS